jgi:hypothetical protein
MLVVLIHVTWATHGKITVKDANLGPHVNRTFFQKLSSKGVLQKNKENESCGKKRYIYKLCLIFGT